MIAALLVYLAFSGLAILALVIESHRYNRLRWMYYRDQQRLAELRWERDSAFRG